jgi:cytochrome b561
MIFIISRNNKKQKKILKSIHFLLYNQLILTIKISSYSLLSITTHIVWFVLPVVCKLREATFEQRKTIQAEWHATVQCLARAHGNLHDTQLVQTGPLNFLGELANLIISTFG